MNTINQKGFTLIEVLIALLVFAVGLLGTLDSSIRSTRISMDNNARAMMSSIASQEIEPLYIEASKVTSGSLTEAAFVTSLQNLDGKTVTTRDGKYIYTINIKHATDNDNNALSTAASNALPIRVVFEISYVGLTKTISTLVNYTFVW